MQKGRASERTSTSNKSIKKNYAREESMPVIEHLAVLLLERAPVRHGILGLEARQPEPARAVLARKDCV